MSDRTESLLLQILEQMQRQTVAVMRCGGNLSSVLRDPAAWDGREWRE